MSSSGVQTCSRISFRLGQLLLVCGLICFLVSLITPHWVVRPSVNWANIANPNSTKVTEHYGIFKACQQESPFGYQGSECGPLWENLNYVEEGAVRYIQFVMVISGLLYFTGLVLEFVQVLPLKKYRNFLAMNRVVEIFVGVAAVLVLKGMVIFAGEIKNKAERVVGQDDEETGWGFIVGLLGLFFTVAAMVLTIMFRELPVPSPRAKGGSWVRNGWVTA